MKFFHLIPALALALCLSPRGAPASPANWNVDVPVHSGDNLWNIAGVSFNDPFLWPLIYDANKDLIKNPDLIQPGWRLSMPVDPSDAELAAALQTAKLYKESLPLPMPAKAPAPPSQQAAVAEEPLGQPEARLPFEIANLTIIVYAFYLLMLAFVVGVVSLVHMRERPHYEVPLHNPKGVLLKPWASISEISGYAIPEMNEEELREAA